MTRVQQLLGVAGGAGLLLLCAAPADRRGPEAESVRADLLIQHVRVFDPVAGTFTRPTDILIRGDRIAATGNLDPPAGGVTVLDAAGKYAVSGLWDSHVHLSFLTLGGDSSVRAVLAAFVRNGIMNVRDVGGPVDTVAALSERVAAGRVLGPRVHYAGPVIGRGPLDAQFQEVNSILPASAVVVESTSQIDTLLDRLVARGATMAKARDRWDPELFRYFVTEARRRSLHVVWDPGLPILNPLPIDSAVAAGVTSVEHARAPWPAVLPDDLAGEVGRFLTPGVDYASGEELLLRIMALGEGAVVRERLTALADRWARKGTYFCPTLLRAEGNVSGNPPERYRQPFHGLLAVSRLFTRELTARGVRLLVGQDAIDPGGTGDEMEALARAGVPPVEILRAATLYPAQSLGLAERFGSLDRGKVADIVLLDADPLDRIENIRSVWRVVYAGELLPVQPSPR